jgi:hypothetical protein
MELLILLPEYLREGFWGLSSAGLVCVMSLMVPLVWEVAAQRQEGYKRGQEFYQVPSSTRGISIPAPKGI